MIVAADATLDKGALERFKARVVGELGRELCRCVRALE